MDGFFKIWFDKEFFNFIVTEGNCPDTYGLKAITTEKCEDTSRCKECWNQALNKDYPITKK